MATVYQHGETRPRVCPVQTAQAVEVGDLVGLSSGNVVRAEDETWTTDLATTQALFAARFLGVAGQRKVANVAKPYGNSTDNRMRVDTGGVYKFTCASASFAVGALVGPAKQSGDYLESQKVAAVADQRLAIGRVVQATSSETTVLVEILSNQLPESQVAVGRIISIPITLAQLANGDVLTAWTPGFSGKIVKVEFAVTVPVTTAAKAATLNLEIGTTNLTGGVVSLTSANCTPLGAVIAGTAVTAANSFGPTDTLSVEAASVTTFVEGAGVLLVTVI